MSFPDSAEPSPSKRPQFLGDRDRRVLMIAGDHRQS